MNCLYILPKNSCHKISPIYLGIAYKKPHLAQWEHIVATLKTLNNTVTIAIVGKYIALKDAYKSLYEALIHAQIPTHAKVKIVVDAEELTPENISAKLNNSDGILVPGGFGDRGVEGKILAVRYAREHKIPFFGILFRYGKLRL